MTRNPLLWTASIAVLVLTAAAWMVATEAAGALHAWGAGPALLSAQLSRVLDGDPDSGTSEGMMPLRQVLLLHVDSAREDVTGKANAQITALRGDVMARIDNIEADAKATGTAINSRAGETLAEVQAIHADLKPVLVNAATLTANYAALPDRLGAEMRPSWLSIQPEITCRQPDGSGYGGCMRGRLNGMFGEAVKVGGIFTQHFPSLITSFDGIQRDVHGWTDKYVMPHKLTPWQKVKVGLNVGKDVGIAGLRGGVF